MKESVLKEISSQSIQAEANAKTFFFLMKPPQQSSFPWALIEQYKFSPSLNKPTGCGSQVQFIQINSEICEKKWVQKFQTVSKPHHLLQSMSRLRVRLAVQLPWSPLLQVADTFPIPGLVAWHPPARFGCVEHHGLNSLVECVLGSGIQFNMGHLSVWAILGRLRWLSSLQWPVLS